MSQKVIILPTVSGLLKLKNLNFRANFRHENLKMCENCQYFPLCNGSTSVVLIWWRWASGIQLCFAVVLQSVKNQRKENASHLKKLHHHYNKPLVSTAVSFAAHCLINCYFRTLSYANSKAE